MLDGQAVGVPAKPALHMEALHGPVPRDNVFDGRREQVAVMRQSSRKGRAIVEGIEGSAHRELDLVAMREWSVQRKYENITITHLSFEGFDSPPPFDGSLLLLREVNRHAGPTFHGMLKPQMEVEIWVC